MERPGPRVTRADRATATVAVCFPEDPTMRNAVEGGELPGAPCRYCSNVTP